MPARPSLRAAHQILRELIVREPGSCGPIWEPFAEHMAAIIDRETFLPELLRDGAALLENIDGIALGIPPNMQGAESLRLLTYFRNALTAANGA